MTTATIWDEQRNIYCFAGHHSNILTQPQDYYAPIGGKLRRVTMHHPLDCNNGMDKRIRKKIIQSLRTSPAAASAAKKVACSMRHVSQSSFLRAFVKAVGEFKVANPRLVETRNYKVCIAKGKSTEWLAWIATAVPKSEILPTEPMSAADDEAGGSPITPRRLTPHLSAGKLGFDMEQDTLPLGEKNAQALQEMAHQVVASKSAEKIRQFFVQDLVICDDAIYSGKQAALHIKGIVDLYDLYRNEIAKNYGIRIPHPKVHVIAPFTTARGRELLHPVPQYDETGGAIARCSKYQDATSLYSLHTMPTVADKLGPQMIDALNQEWYPHEDVTSVEPGAGQGVHSRAIVLFSHKIANSTSVPKPITDAFAAAYNEVMQGASATSVTPIYKRKWILFSNSNPPSPVKRYFRGHDGIEKKQRRI